MNSSDLAAASLIRRPASPLIRAMLDRGCRDLDPWLAGMNGLALAFLMTALCAATPGADASYLTPEAGRDQSEAPLPSIMVELAVPPGVVGEEAAVPPPPPAEPPADQTVTDTANWPPPPATEVWRELPAMIDPVAVTEPGRRPAPQPALAESFRPASGGSRRPVPAPAKTGSPAAGLAGPAAPSTVAGGGGRGANPQPPYPAFARRDRLQGTVIVSIAVKNGAVASVRVLNSSGSAALDQYAVNHVQRRWKWPVTISQTFTQPFRFVLK